MRGDDLTLGLGSDMMIERARVRCVKKTNIICKFIEMKTWFLLTNRNVRW